MKEIILSLCIPTYNRCGYLCKCIDSIISQEIYKTGKVEIVISDNNSSDETEIEVKKYKEKHPNIFYYKNKVNLKDKNFYLALSHGKGLYRKLINDKLILNDKSIEYIFRLIEEQCQDKPLIFWGNGDVNIREELLICEFREFVRNASFWITSISSFGVWEDDMTKITCLNQESEAHLWQVYKTFEMACQKNNIIMCNKPLFVSQQIEKKDYSYGIYKVFCDNYLGILNKYLNKQTLQREDVAYIEKDLLFGFLSGLLVRWELKDEDYIFGDENLKQLIKNRYSNNDYWMEFLVFYEWYKLKMKFKRYSSGR